MNSKVNPLCLKLDDLWEKVGRPELKVGRFRTKRTSAPAQATQEALYFEKNPDKRPGIYLIFPDVCQGISQSIKLSVSAMVVFWGAAARFLLVFLRFSIFFPVNAERCLFVGFFHHCQYFDQVSRFLFGNDLSRTLAARVRVFDQEQVSRKRQTGIQN